MTSKAKDFRLRGNHEFSQGSYDHAVALYTAGLEQHDIATEERIVLLCNRSAAYYLQQEFAKSQEDALTAYTLSGRTHPKAAFRVVKAALQTKDYTTARDTLRAAHGSLQNAELTLQQQVPPSNEKDMPDRRKRDEEEESSAPAEEPSASQQSSLVDIKQQREAFQELYQQLLAAESATPIEEDETTITTVQHRPISIREFQLPKSDNVLGHGNFSEILQVTHKTTHETFALKRIAKKQAADLYKRQHPNVYNEIQMERRVLLERLPPTHSSGIIRMYHAFQDYLHLYYLMEYHAQDLWTQLRYKQLPTHSGADTTCLPHETCIMLGSHRSRNIVWIQQLIDALEFCHAHGIVHRDLKTENILLDAYDNIVLIDFGTAKDLVVADLNGPEFVGTPDFMAPEAVDSQQEHDSSTTTQATTGPAADLWALGCVCFQLQTGHTPYWSPSPYLAFLKIKRARRQGRGCTVLRPTGILDDACWDFIQQLLQGDPTQRLGADAFIWNNNTLTGTKSYDTTLRSHSYLASTPPKKRHVRQIPSLWDLAVRACAESLYQDSLLPANEYKNDMTRLLQDDTTTRRERDALFHVLDRRRLFKKKSLLYSRFGMESNIRFRTRDVVGLTQMNDDEGKPPKPHDPYSKVLQAFSPISIAVLHNPLLVGATKIDEERKRSLYKRLKQSIAHVNRTRPDVVVVLSTPQLEARARKLVDKIFVPSVLHDQTHSFTFWKSGVQCIAVGSDNTDSKAWLQEQLEQVQMSKHPLFCFGSPALDTHQMLVRGRACALVGTTANEVDKREVCSVDRTIVLSEEEKDDVDFDWRMQVYTTSSCSVRTFTILEEPDQWKQELIPFDHE